MTRVGFLTESEGWGGAEVTLARLLEALGPGIEATLIGTNASTLERLAARRPGTPVLGLAEQPGRLDLGARRADRAALARLGLDALHVNLTSLVACRGRLALACSVPRLPVVAVHHLPMWPVTGPLGAPGRELSRRLLRHGVAVNVGVGERVARTVERRVGLPPGTVRAIPNGVPDRGPCRRPRGRGRAVPVIGTIGRLEAHKGLDVLVEAAAVVEPARFVIVGRGPELDRIGRRAAELGLGGRLELRPWTDTPHRVLEELDVFVLPSRDEALPLTVLEAMMAGLPVVATDVGSVGEAVDDGVTGWLVPPGRPGPLADALRRLAADPALRTAMGKAGRRRARERFTVAAMASAYRSLYESLGPPPDRGVPRVGASTPARPYRARRGITAVARRVEEVARREAVRRRVPAPVRVGLGRAVPGSRRPDFLTGSVLRGSMTGRDVLRVVSALDAMGIGFWLAGGWGVDALLGRQSRRHDDVDVVLADYDRDEAGAVAALAPLGFRAVQRGSQEDGTAGAWMPEATLLDDGAGHRVELLSMDRRLIRAAIGGPPAALTAVGVVGSTPVPCLSVPAQVVVHAGYENRPHDRLDVERLLGRFGAP